MEFKKVEPVIVVDETKEGVFGNEKFTKELEEMKEVKEFNRRWMESLSDCA